MFRKVIVFGLVEMIQKKKNEDRVPGSGFGFQVGYGGADRHNSYVENNRIWYHHRHSKYLYNKPIQTKRNKSFCNFPKFFKIFMHCGIWMNHSMVRP